MNSVCILVPTYNNERTVGSVLRKIVEYGLPVLVVNDGSTDSTSEVLSEVTGITVLTHPENRGKGAALQTGFSQAFADGFDYAITIDSDGQHDPENIDLLFRAVRDTQETILVMGNRNMKQDGIPAKSSFGNAFSNFWFRLETGITLSDTQTGFRAYPLKPISKMKWFTNRFEHEIELIVRLAWKGVHITEVPVAVYYPEDRVSHFRPFNDFMRISVLNTVLVALTALYYLPRRILSVSHMKEVIRKVRDEMNMHKGDPLLLATSIGVGLFFGVFPIWGFQMLVAFYIAKKFRLNSVVVLASSNISIPPILPFLLFLSLWTGKLLLGGEHVLPELHSLTLEMAKEYSIQYLLGAVVFSIILGIVGFLLSYGLLFSASKLRKSKKTESVEK